MEREMGRATRRIAHRAQRILCAPFKQESVKLICKNYYKCWRCAVMW